MICCADFKGFRGLGGSLRFGFVSLSGWFGYSGCV